MMNGIILVETIYMYSFFHNNEERWPNIFLSKAYGYICQLFLVFLIYPRAARGNFESLLNLEESDHVLGR